MITNRRQYRVTKAAIRRFDEELTNLDEISADLDPELRALQRAGVESQLAELREQAAAYEALTRNPAPVIEALTLDDLPAALVQARNAAGLSQAELAARVGMKKQQIQRYEAGRYATAPLAVIGRVVRALGDVEPVRIHPVRKNDEP